MSAPAGWYPDAAGAPRWWDGYGWADEYRAPPDPRPPQAAPGTSSHTVWVWLIVLLPLLSLYPAFVYLDQMLRGMVDLVALFPTGGSTPDPQRLVAAELALFFNPWFLVLLVIGWGSSALYVWFAFLDARELERRGFADPFHWLWTLLSPLAYVIGRHAVIRRRGGKGAAPLIVTIAIQIAVFIAAMVWTVVLVLQMTAAILPSNGASTALPAPAESASPVVDEWVVVTFEDRDADFDLSLMDAMLETELAADEALTRADAGQIDGNEIGAGEYALYFVGPDAERIWEVIQPVFDDAPVPWTQVQLMQGLDDPSPVTITP